MSNNQLSPLQGKGSGRTATSIARNYGLVLLLTLVLPLADTIAAQRDKDAAQAIDGSSPKTLFEKNCSACHSLELPRSQRLDRKTWRWVVDDMVNEFGATWITKEQQHRIIDYLADNYGPDRSR